MRLSFLSLPSKSGQEEGGEEETGLQSFPLKKKRKKHEVQSICEGMCDSKHTRRKEKETLNVKVLPQGEECDVSLSFSVSPS